MRQLWRLSEADYAERFDGGFGLGHAGRWNQRGRPITYCSTGPALCVLENLAHIEDLGLLPDATMLVRYDVPDRMRIDEVRLEDLPESWRFDERLTRAIGNAWLDGGSTCLLRVPSVIVPIADTNDRNCIVNHRHQDATRIKVSHVEKSSTTRVCSPSHDVCCGKFGNERMRGTREFDCPLFTWGYE